jgi:hypothetical protein
MSMSKYLNRADMEADSMTLEKVQALRVIRQRATHILTTEDRVDLLVFDFCSGVHPEHTFVLKVENKKVIVRC